MPDIWTSIKNADLTWNHELELHSQCDVMEALTKATIERCKASEGAVPSIVAQNGTVASGTTITLKGHNLQVGELVYLQWTRSSVDYREYNIEITARDTDTITVATTATDGAITVILQTVKRIYTIKSYTDAIQTKVSELIPLYINHLDNYGNWNGQAVIPNWDEASMLTAIGAGSRLVADRINVLGAWAKQQYLIINNLLWVRYSAGFERRTKNLDYGSSWADAVARFNAGAWSAWSTYEGSSQAENEYNYGNYRIGTPAQHRFTIDKTAVLGTLEFIAEVYEYYTWTSYIYEDVERVCFWNLNGSMVPNYNRIKTSTSCQSYDYVNFSETIWIDNGEPPRPTTDIYETQAGISDTEPPVAVLKFDGPNGFKFRDYILTDSGEIVTNNGEQVTI